jgi:hypothetical protein
LGIWVVWKGEGRIEVEVKRGSESEANVFYLGNGKLRVRERKWRQISASAKSPVK